MSPANRSDATLAVKRDIHDEVATGHAGDGGVFFVNRIAIQDSTVSVRVFEQFRPVPAA